MRCLSIRSCLLLLLVGVVTLAAAASGVAASTAQRRHRSVRAELVRVTPGSLNGTADVTLTWDAFDNNYYGGSETLSRINAVGNRDPVTAYEAQVAVSGSGDWRSLGTTISGLPDAQSGGSGAKHTDVHERQRIVTRADAGATIADGFFRLTLSRAGVSALDVHQRSITPAIPFDATEAQLQAAIESLDVVSRVQVFRQALPAGTFEWTVLFDPVATGDAAKLALDCGDLPLLALYTETISAAWSGPGDQVAIFSDREAVLNHVVCTSACMLDAVKLTPTGNALTFRVRAHFTHVGWSEWSDASAPLWIPRTEPPRAPTRPEFVSATVERITVQWTYAAAAAQGVNPFETDDGKRFPVLSYLLQQQCDDDLGWMTARTDVTPGPSHSVTIASSTLRPPNSSCVFRVAAASANGVGPFSRHSLLLRTLAQVPDAPRALSIQRDPLVLTWQPPRRDGGSVVVGYDVQYRPATSSTWINGPTAHIDAARCTFAFDAASLASYTRYVVRVRARNAIGTSVFTAPTTTSFLTEFRLDTSTQRSADSSNSAAMIRGGRQQVQILLSAHRDRAANIGDPNYVHGIANGGTGGKTRRRDGEPGLVVVFPITRRGDRQPELMFFYTGTTQVYRVPVSHTSDPMAQIVAVDVYGWGGGGGSGTKSLVPATAANSGNEEHWTTGGGGAFARGVFRVAPADTLDVFVGGGGAGGSSQDAAAGAGGFHGGGDAGGGDFPGGGGGGASEIMVNSKTVLVAAGGGGGGATDYCCAHGGGGGISSELGAAEPGAAPNASTMPLGLIEVAHTMRDDFRYTNVLGDDVAFTDARARHTHFDMGFAADSADYSVLATGGTGASISAPGRGGTASSFKYSRAGALVWSDATGGMEIDAPLAAFAASSGGHLRGGKGQDGKEGGGGGGAGFYGGGGGGSGIDAGGGGGGSSYIAANALADVDDVAFGASSSLLPQQRHECVASFRASAVSASSIQLRWSTPSSGFSHGVVGYVVEMANRSASEDFRVVVTERAPSSTTHPNNKPTTVTVRGLEPASWYRFRVLVLFRAGAGAYSSVETLQTRPQPRNVWRRVGTDSNGGVRSFSAQTTHAGLRFTDPMPLRWFPSPRRGHSLVLVDTHLYLFGGVARGYACNAAHKRACRVRAPGVTNELWRFERATSTWMEVAAATASQPPAREKHSAVVLDNRMLVFGGRTGDTVNDGTTAALNDLWELSISSSAQRTTASLRDLETSLPIRDGAEVFTLGSVSNTPGLCVANLRVQLRITHACVQTLLIQLFGPGPSTFPQRQQTDKFPVDAQGAATTETVWSNTNGFTTGTKRATPATPSARSFPVTLQRPTMFATNQPCQSGTHNIVVDSTLGQLDPTSSDASGTGETTPQQPLEALSVFHQLSASGGWTLSVSDTVAGGHEGVLESWDIAFELVPCVTTFAWRQLGAAEAGVTGVPPSARYAHTAVVHDSSMFVFGGRSGASGNELLDVHRLDYTTDVGSTIRWTQLVPLTASSGASNERRFYAGRMTLLTPFGLLAVGHGLRSPRRHADAAHHFTTGVYVGQKRVDDDRRGWQRVAVVSADGDADTAAPVSRYWSASAYVRDAAGSRMYMFGGQDDTTLLDDFWQLDLDAVAEANDLDSMRARRREVCDWRLASTAYHQQWSASCGATDAAVAQRQASVCDMSTLLLYVWCSERYQSIAV